MTDARQIIDTLGLRPHPEGGHYREIHRAPGEGRSPLTAIYYLLAAGERSRWHRIDATEIWHWYAGAPLLLSVSEDGMTVTRHALGIQLDLGQRPQAIIPPRAWQAAEPQGDWCLMGCTVGPGFEFFGFEMAPEGWEPG
ncbi:cupin domain-containing protein [Iodidimonas sp. SYSU 1G8]|uniref:cupin domain-containing protein n=1 Tax=Iodidimonas sp. SYSU 1G8 TaxID=3133967 RepID=UPI0031FF0753